MDDSGVVATTAIIISVVTSIVAVVNHKRIRSSCCGRKLDVSVDIENTTPPQIKAPTVEV